MLPLRNTHLLLIRIGQSGTSSHLKQLMDRNPSMKVGNTLVRTHARTHTHTHTHRHRHTDTDTTDTHTHTHTHKHTHTHTFYNLACRFWIVLMWTLSISSATDDNSFWTLVRVTSRAWPPAADASEAATTTGQPTGLERHRQKIKTKAAIFSLSTSEQTFWKYVT